VPILLGRLSAVDDSLFIGTEAEPQLFNSFIEWYQNRTSIWGQHKIDQILVSEFGIETLTINKEEAGFFGKHGFYSSSQKKWFSEAINEQVLNGDFGLIASRSSFSDNKNVSVFATIALSHYARSMEGKPVCSVSVSDGGLMVKTNQNAFRHIELRGVESPLLDGSNIDIPSNEPIWNIEEINETIKSAGSGGLVVFAGTDTHEIESHPDFIANNHGVRPTVVLKSSELTSSSIENAQRKLRGRNSVVVILSEAKNFVDIYEELKSAFSSEEVILYLAHYEIRVSVDKLCGECKEITHNKSGVSRLAVGFNLKPGDYASVGNGCSNCVGGYEGTVVLTEKIKSSELTGEAIVNYEKDRLKEFVNPSALIEKNKDVRSVYKELNSHIAHMDVSLEDGIKAVL
tara:strand:+ start:287133 stop:288335 length:1203 start_codon:yes stop_codon:yes gene_type:complete